MNTIILYGVLAASVLLAGWAGYRNVWDKGYQQAKMECAQAAQTAKDAAIGQANLAATETQQGDEDAKIVYKTITKEVEKYIDRHVYRNVCLDTDGLRDVNAALLHTRPAASQPDQPLPEPDSPGERAGESGA